MRGLTNYLEKVGKQDDLLGGPRSVGPVAEQRPRQEAREAERRQGQTQEVRRCIQGLQVLPYCGQYHSWGDRSKQSLFLSDP